jgi:CCR4-NOT transcription complex subunit 1
VDLKDVNPTSLLKDRVCEVEGNPDFSNKDVAASQTQISSGISRSTNHVELQSVISSTSHAYATPHLPSNSMVEDDNVAFMMPKHVSSHTLTQVSPSETALASQSPFSLTQVCFTSIVSRCLKHRNFLIPMGIELFLMTFL